MTNLGQWARADSLLQRVDRRRGDLNQYNRAWLDYRIAFVHGDQEAQLKAIRFAAKLAPTSKAAYNHAVVAFQSGHLHEALKTIEAIRPDRGPMRGFAPYWTLYGEILHALQLYDREYVSGIAAENMYPGRLFAITPIVRGLIGMNRIAEIEPVMRGVDTLRADPMQWDHGHLFMELGEELRAHGHASESAAYFDRALEWLTANHAAEWRSAQAQYALARWPEARATIGALRRAQSANSDYLGISGLLAARAGDRAVAATIADTLSVRESPYDFGVRTLYRAKIAAVLGDREASMSSLRDSFAQGYPFDLWFHRASEFAMLAGTSSFATMLRGKD
jgi:hypothetical protein